MSPDAYRQCSYRLDSQDVIREVGAGWNDFARDNEASHLCEPHVIGHSLWEFITGDSVVQFYKMLLDRVRKQEQGAHVPFRCDAPAVRRFMEIWIAPSPDGAIAFQVHLLREEPRDSVALLDRGVPRSDELIRVCSWCKRVLLSGEELVEVEEAVRRLGLFATKEVPDLTHTICDECDRRMVEAQALAE